MSVYSRTTLNISYPTGKLEININIISHSHLDIESADLFIQFKKRKHNTYIVLLTSLSSLGGFVQ